MNADNQKLDVESNSPVPLARITAREVSAEELLQVAGGIATGSRVPPMLPGTDADRER